MMQVKKENLLNYSRYSRLALMVTARYMAEVFDWLYKGGSLDLEKFLKQRKVIKQFQKLELEKIKVKTDPTNMDVTCLYKLLYYTCDIPSENPEWNTAVKAGQKRSLGQILYRLRDIRNSVSHKEPGTLTQVSDENLNDLAKELEELLAEMLTLAGKECGKQDSVVAETICNMKADVVREQHADDGITVREFVTLGRQELLKRKEREFSYVEPHLVQNGKNTFDTVIPLSGLPSSRFRDGSQPQVIQVTGEAGAGKTSLCKALMAWWLMDDPKAKALADYHLLLDVTCAQVKSRDLHRYLHGMLPETTKLCDTASLTRLLREAKILWLIDGWDEATKDAPWLLQDLLQSRGESHIILATCRPGFSVTLTNQFIGQRIFYVSFARFQKEEMKELVRGKLPDVDNTFLKNFLDILHSFPNEEQDDFSNPLKLQLMARMYLMNCLPELLRQPSLVYIYHNMIERQRESLIVRCQKDSAPGEDVEQKIDAWLERLYKVSFDSARSDPSLLLTVKSVKNLSKECGVPEKLCLSSFLVCPSLFGVMAHSYAFYHDTQRCVFATRHLECCCKDDDNPEAKLRMVLDVDSCELENHMDPYLGIYDLVTQFLLVIRILLSRISCGWICNEVRQKSLCQALLRLAKKFVHIVKCDHLPTDRWIEASALRSRLVPVFLQVMEMWTRGLFHVSVSATFLVDLFASLLEGDEDPVRWLEVIRRCEVNEELARAVSRKIDGRLWVISDGDIRAATMLLKYITPEKVTVNVSDSKWLPQLHELLLRLSKSRVRLELNIQSHLRDLNSKDDSDSYLELICRPQAKCSLTIFSGHLSVSGLPLLSAARRLTSLNLRITQPNAVCKLTEVAPKLTQLNSLILIYDNKKFIVPDSFVDGSRGIFSQKLQVHLILPHLRENSVNMSVNFISRFSEQYLRLIVGNLDLKGVKNLVTGLENKAVIVDTFAINVYVEEYKMDISVNIGSLPMQTSMGDFLTRLHDLFKDPLRHMLFVKQM
ncbi:hypothetical protein E2C01_022665 [Portunus trituberculatus]|uniref:NACHT domain-containing protein n=1 Tax=Portunus trituberculatus TaxID=210409 RepID=A0A5B7E7X6_PORTR|nr:hypothetical protein [Portunus trituberculatus]